MKRVELEVARRVKAMTRHEIVLKAIEGRLTWMQAADIVGLSARQMRRLYYRYKKHGVDGLTDGRRGPRRKRIPLDAVQRILWLRREKYRDFSVKHFHEFLTEKHGGTISYTWVKTLLLEAGLAEKAPGRGKYRRRRERRPMRGMLLHLDASTHVWVEGLPAMDLNLVLDDADGRILHAAFVPQEGTMSTLQALGSVLKHHGRFCELYTDRGSHFCRTTKAGDAPDEVQQGQVTRALKSLGIRHILARSPQARGRSERAFGTIQGRLPQELRAAGIHDYAAAQDYLERVFVRDFNRRFTVKPTEPGTAFTQLASVDLELLLSQHHERVVRNDNAIVFGKLVLQLPAADNRTHYVRCPVLVHELINGTLGVSYQGRLIARFDRLGAELRTPHRSAA
jgi:transposase